MEVLNNRIGKDDVLDNELDANPDNYCMICLEPFDNCSSIKLNCTHKFHTDCMLKSISKTNISETNKKKCPYCRTPFSYLPYNGGEFIKYIHAPDALSLYLSKMNIILESNINWDNVKISEDRFFVKSGKYINNIGILNRITPTMVILKSSFNSSNIFRTTKNNVQLLIEKNMDETNIDENNKNNNNQQTIQYV